MYTLSNVPFVMLRRDPFSVVVLPQTFTFYTKKKKKKKIVEVDFGDGYFFRIYTVVGLFCCIYIYHSVSARQTPVSLENSLFFFFLKSPSVS